MTKISKEIKRKALLEYFDGFGPQKRIAQKYGINYSVFRMLVSAYRTHGLAVLYDPPKVDSQFRLTVAEWKIEHNASRLEVAAKFGYVGSLQIHQWEKIYRKSGPNGLLSITKGRKPKMPNKSDKKRKNNQYLSSDQNRIKQLEKENLELRIKNEALKLFASMKQPTGKKPR